MYSKLILNIFSNPANAGRIMKPDGIASLSNLDETANVEFSLRVEDDVIKDCNFRAQANPYIIAICSTITKMVIGKNIDDVALEQTAVKNELGEDSDIDINFCIECMDMAIQDYVDEREKQGKPKSTRGRKKKVVDQIIDAKTAEAISQAIALATEQPKAAGLGATSDNATTNNDADDDFGEDFISQNAEVEDEPKKDAAQPHVTKAFEGSIFNNPIFVNFFNGKHE